MMRAGVILPATSRFSKPTIEPILVVAGSPPLHDPAWIYEPKFDGFRGVLYLCHGECYIRSKRSNVLRRFADLALRVGAELHARDAILDGEVVATCRSLVRRRAALELYTRESHHRRVRLRPLG